MTQKQWPHDESEVPELKPCPFCGGKAKLLLRDNSPPHIICDECPAMTGIAWGRVGEDQTGRLIRTWNNIAYRGRSE